MSIKQYVVYVLINTKNDKMYTGKSQNFKQRWQNHQYRATMDEPKWVINRAMKKHGIEAFEKVIVESFNVDEDALTKDEIKQEYERLKKLEQHYIYLFATLAPNGYNITEGGDGTVGYKRPPEDCAKISKRMKEQQKGENNSFFGKKHSDETITIISRIVKANHEAGKYNQKNIDQRKFTADEEILIIKDYTTNNLTVEQLVDKYDCSRNLLSRLFARQNIEATRRPLTPEHLAKLAKCAKDNVPKRLATLSAKNAPKQKALTDKILELRAAGMLQKDIAKVVGITQVSVSKYLIGAGKRTQSDKTRKPKSG